MRPLKLLVGVFAAIVLGAGCNPTPAAPTEAFLLKANLTDFAITGNTTFLGVAQSSQLAARVNSPVGQLNVTNRATWTSADESIATVSSAGLLKSVGFGSTTVSARFNDEETTLKVDVLAPTGLLVGGTLTFSFIGRTNQLSVFATWPAGQTRTVTNDSTWSSADPTIASISSTGLLRSNAFGSTTVTAKYQNLTATAKVDVVVAFVALSVQGNLSLNGPGDSSALTAIVTFSDGTTRNVTTETTWTTSNPSIASISPQGVVTANSFGSTSVAANYQGHAQVVGLTVTPAGSFVIFGRAREPGNGQGQFLGVPGFNVRDLQTGFTTTTDNTGNYSLTGVFPNDRLRFEKDGWEPAEITIANKNSDGSAAVQRVVRVNAGSNASIFVTENDLRYDLNSVTWCTPCRLIRVVTTGAGTLHLKLTWTQNVSRLSLWVNGQLFEPTTGPLQTTADISVAAGETLVYAGVIGGAPFANPNMTLTLTTSLTAAPGPLLAPAMRKE